MAQITTGGNYTDIKDIHDPAAHGKIRPFVNLLAALSPLVSTAYWTEANDGDKHQTEMVVDMPEPMYRRLYQGVPPTKETTQIVTDTAAILADHWSTDVQALLRLKDRDAQSYKRFTRGQAHIQGMATTLESGFFYGNTAGAPEQFKGLAPRFNAIGSDPWGKQIIDAGGTGSDNTSIWFVTMGDRQCGAFYPSGIPNGIKHYTDGTLENPKLVDDASGNRYPAAQDFLELNVGMYVADPRYVVRVANIDVNALRAGTVDIYKYLVQAYHRHFGINNDMLKRMSGLPGITNDDMEQLTALVGKTYIYCNREVSMAVDLASINKGAGDNFRRIGTQKEMEGGLVDFFRSHEFCVSDALLSTEARVV